MVRKLVCLITLIFPLTLAPRASATTGPRWSGTFEYYARLGYDGGGTASTGAPISYDLVLTLGSAGSCNVTAKGYATDETVICKISPRPDSGIDVKFAGLPSAANEIGLDKVKTFTSGEILFSLLPGPKPSNILTIWRRFHPVTAEKSVGSYLVGVK